MSTKSGIQSEMYYIQRIQKVDSKGRGIIKINDKTFYLPFVLENEWVICRKPRRRKEQEADLVQILYPSTERIKPSCKYFGICGGCSLQHFNKQTQVVYKQQLLKRYLEEAGIFYKKDDIAIMTGIQTEGYRRKARLGVKYVKAKDKILVGFRERNKSFLTDMDSCKVLHPIIGEELITLQKLIASLSIYEHIPQIEVAIDEERGALIIRHLKPFLPEDIEQLIQFGKTKNLWMYLQPKGLDSIARLYPKALEEPKYMSYQIKPFNIQIYFNPSDFTQVNHEINQQMIRKVIELLELKKEDIVLDLFCGLGNFSLPTALFCKEVVGVEFNKGMTEKGSWNAEVNNLQNVIFYTADLNKKLTDNIFLRKYQFNKMIMDPPRTGAEEVCNEIEYLNIQKIIYVSCNGVTFARDGGILIHKKNYQMKHCMVLNMFPHTTHFEMIGVFEKL